MGSKKKMFIVLAILGLACGYAYTKVHRVTTPSAAINNGNDGEGPPNGFGGGPGGPGGGGRDQMFQDAAKAANLSSSQIKQIEEVRASGDWRNMRTKMEDIITTPQREAMRASFQAQQAKLAPARQAARDKQVAKMKAVLGDDQYKRYQERRAAQGRGGRGGPGGGRGGRGGGGGGQGGPGGPGGGPGGPGGQQQANGGARG